MSTLISYHALTPTASSSRTTVKQHRPATQMVDDPAKSAVSLLTPPPDWQAAALCTQTDPEIFFPEKGGSSREAEKVCGRCPVAAECLDQAMANDERFGVWGGTTRPRRRRLAKSLTTQS